MSGVGSTTSLDPTGRRVWRAGRAPALVAAGVLLTGFVLAVLGSGAQRGLLDPRAVDRAGSRALAVLLADQGVRVERVTTTAAATGAATADSTLLVARPDLLLATQRAAVARSPADLVVVAPEDASAYAPGTRTVAGEGTEVLRPACELPAAVRAGSAELGGTRYDVTPAPGARAQLCYAAGGRAGLVQMSSGGRLVTLLGDPAPLLNDRLDEAGNAALALGVLGGHPHLVWYLPSLADVPAGERESFYSLVPRRVWWAAAQLAVAVLLLGLWRARRLGPVVAEPLPVVVRAAEAVEGRARLYRRGRARQRAGELLRAAPRARVLPLLGLPAGAEPASVVDAVAGRTGRGAAEVGGLLYGAAPEDDAALVRLADDLDALEREVRRS